MAFNTPLAVKVLAHIEELNDNDDELQHRQVMWGVVVAEAEKMDRIYDEETGELVGLGSCQTAMCFGGWTCTLEGVKLVWEEIDDGSSSNVGDMMGATEVDRVLVANETTENELISDAACRLLGIKVPKECSFDTAMEDCAQNYEEQFYGGEMVVECGCDPYDPNWNYDEDFPHLFDADNDLGDLYAYVADYAEITVDELMDLVTEERERYAFDDRLFSSAAKAAEVI